MYDSVILFYQHYQPLYDEIRYIVPTIEFIQGVTFDLISELVKEKYSRWKNIINLKTLSC